MFFDEDWTEDRPQERAETSLSEGNDAHSDGSTEESSLSVDMSDPEINDTFNQTQITDNPSFELAYAGDNSSSGSNKGKASFEQTVSAIAQLLSKEGLKENSIAGTVLAESVLSQFRRGGAPAVDNLLKSINAKLPDGMKLSGVEDPEHVKHVTREFQQAGLQPPDFMRKLELKDKNNQSLGHLYLSGDSKFMARTAEALNKGKLGKDEAAGRLLMDDIQMAFTRGGEAAVNLLLDDINATLKDGKHLEVRNDPKFEKDIKERFHKAGLPAPSLIKIIDLKDKDNNSLGGVSVIIGEQPQRPNRPPVLT